MSPEQRLATITLCTTNLINELHQLNVLRNKFRTEDGLLILRKGGYHDQDYSRQSIGGTPGGARDNWGHAMHGFGG